MISEFRKNSYLFRKKKPLENINFMNNTSILFKSLKLGELTIPNRIIMAAMTRMRCDNETKVPNNIVADYYS